MKPTLCLNLILCLLPIASAQDSDLYLSAPRPLVNVGDQLALRASLEASIAVTPRIEFSTSDTAVASVSPEGVVSGIFPGVATIVARELSTGAVARLEIKVVPSRISISPSNTDLRTGDTVRLTAQALDGSNRPIPGVSFRFFSGQPNVAGIATDGTLTALAEGSLTVTAQIESAPNTFGFYSSFNLRIGPRREYALRRIITSDPTPAAAISAFTGLSSAGELLGGLVTLSNGGQAAVVRDQSGQLRVVTYAGQSLPNVGRMVTRIGGLSTNSRGDVLASVEYPDPWCTYGLVLFPRNGPETQLLTACNPYVSRHAMTDDGGAFYFQDDSGVRYLRKRMADGTTATWLATAPQDTSPNALRSLNDVWPARSGAVALVRGITASGRSVTLWVTDKTSKIIFGSGDTVGGKAVNNHDEMLAGADNIFYGRCNSQNASLLCRVTADGFQSVLATNDTTPNGVRFGWVQNVFDVWNGKVLMIGDWLVGDNYSSRLGIFEAGNLTLLSNLPSWNGVAFAQMTASGNIFAKITESDAVLSSVKAGAETTTVIAKQAPFSTPVPGLPDIAYQTRGSAGSSIIAMGAGEQVVSVDASGVREVLSPLTALPDGGRTLAVGGLAANRNGQAAISLIATGGNRLYRYADSKLTLILKQDGPVASSDSNKFSWLSTWRGSYIGMNANGDIATQAVFGPFERLVFIPNGATQVKTIATVRSPMPNGATINNIGNVVVNDLGQVLFTSTLINGPLAMFLWDGQQVKEVLRRGSTLDGRTLDDFSYIVAGPRNFTFLSNSQGTWRVHSINGSEITTLASGDQPLSGFSRTWGSLSGAITLGGNGDIHIFANASDGSGIVVIRPNGTTASILRAGDQLPDGAFVVQPIGIFAGPRGELHIATHVLDNGVEKVSLYLATPM